MKSDNPSSLATCVWWLRADLGVTLNGSNVAAWADQSGIEDANRNTMQATAPNQPAYCASDPAYNGKPTIGFNIRAKNAIEVLTDATNRASKEDEA
jgi:hypothetical protein